MRRLRWTLVASMAVAPSCRVPDTLGLPCVTHAHCDPGQHCGPQDTCVPGMPPRPPGGTGPVATGTLTGSASGPSSVDTTLVLEGTSSSSGGTTTSTTTGSESSTGPACGQAVGTCDAIDLLFVIDNSGSIAEDNFAVLLPAITSIQDVLFQSLEGMCTYHIGVTTTEPELDFQPSECQQRGALSRAGVLCGSPWPGDPEHVPWVSEEDNIDALGCLLGVGQNNDDDEKQLETTLAAVGPELGAEGACNEGFVREGVPLVIVIVTDEDDDDDSGQPGEEDYRTGSAGSPADWWDALTAIKPAEELATVLIAPTSGDCDWTPLPDNDDGSGAEYALRLLQFLLHFNGNNLGSHAQPIDLCLPIDELTDQISAIDDILTAVCDDMSP